MLYITLETSKSIPMADICKEDIPQVFYTTTWMLLKCHTQPMSVTSGIVSVTHKITFLFLSTVRLTLHWHNQIYFVPDLNTKSRVS